MSVGEAILYIVGTIILCDFIRFVFHMGQNDNDKP